jgi:uncharacterized repeat protein (TIGR03803 family)
MKRFYSPLVCVVVLGLAALVQAQTFTTLYNFTGGSDGGDPVAGVIQDPDGNLYGTTYYGGVYRAGVAYEIDTAGTETVLHSFSGPDGDLPTTPLLRDSEGNLYGTAFDGGSDDCGTAFKIDTAGKLTVLHTFAGGADGCYPEQGLVMGKSGILFGTTNQSGHTRRGTTGRGTIFKVDSAGNFTVLYTFVQSPDGGRPSDGHLMRDRSGNLYGLTAGGRHNDGVLYKLTESGAFSLLHSFKGGTKDGCTPLGSVVQDQAGNLYGTTAACGSNGYGTIWKVSKKGKETILHNFAGGTADGCNPYAGVTMDSKGNLYGVTYRCGADGYGTLYDLSTSGTFILLHSFGAPNGTYPLGEVLLTTNGTLFGTTEIGNYDNGTVWSYVP